MAMQNLTPEESRFAAKIEDMAQLCSQKNIRRFTMFLDERQSAIARQVLSSQKFDNFLFWGGHSEGERTVLGLFPFYEEPDPAEFPIVPVTVTFRPQDVLTHRDFLGSLMGLLIKREALGDILVGKGIAVIFTIETVASIIIQELCKVGRVGVSCEIGLPDELPTAHHYQDAAGTVSSMRLDCVLSMVTNLSREKSSQLIRSQLVAVNGQTADSISAAVEPGDKISARGYGKFLVESVGSMTKKGKIHLMCKKYV